MKKLVSVLAGLATSGSRRSRMLPDVPAYNETGIPELKDYSSTRWLGFAATAFRRRPRANCRTR